MKIFKKLFSVVLLAGASLMMACGEDDPDDGTDTTPLGNCAAASNWEVWVPRQMTNDIKVVNGPTFALEQTIDLSMTGLKNPHGVSFNKDGTKAIVAMLGTMDAVPPFSDGGVVFINTANYTVEGTTVTNQKTHQTVWAPDGSIWAVNVNSPGTITFIDAAARTEIGRLEVGGEAVATRFAPDGTKAFVTNQRVESDASRVDVINVSARTKEGESYKTGKATVTPALATDGKTLFVTNGMSHTVEKIDTSAGDRATAVTTFAGEVMEAHAIALTKDHVLVTARLGGALKVFNRDGTLANNIQVTATSGNAIPDMVAVSPDCARAYVTERADGKLLQIDLTSMSISATLDLMGGYTHGVSVLKKANPDM